MKKPTIIASIIGAVLIVAFAVGLAACGTGPNTATQLGNVEIKEYEGENLSSVNDFRDNSIKGPQYVDITNYHLQVTGLVANSTNYTYDEVINDFDRYQKVVSLDCVEGWSVNILWEGMQVRDILAQAVPLPEAKVVIFHAYDGYTTSFPIEYIVDNPILMAYTMNDIEIPPERGYPFMLVAESKWGYKWIKWITQIELSNDINYKGYWEERGYSNSGDLDKYYFD
ncbi:MAG: oxidoreductase [Chloroflexi bacterium RBG_13_51_18]|nr:MAG: oxidoreductase [Chloroflexi bacterium RBG_13_51_18]